MVAAAAAALLFLGALRAEREQTARFRERAYEAEAQIARLRAEREARPTQPPGVAAPTDPAPLPPPEAEREPAGREPDAAARHDPVWEALVAGHLQTEVQRQLGRSLSSEQEARLMDRLRDVRDAAATLEADPGDDPLASARRRLSRSIVMLEADRAFREELGVGVGDFLRGMDPGQVEDLTTPAPAGVDAPAGPGAGPGIDGME